MVAEEEKEQERPCSKQLLAIRFSSLYIRRAIEKK
jgi:hypothetical protein